MPQTTETTPDEHFMQRAFQLAEYGRGYVSPNPMVGCVLVAEGDIIGEGWHRNYGGPHAEVQAILDAEKRGNEGLLKSATAYVTLEPCSHFGKTPPCADLLIDKKIRKVVVANHDPNPLVAGRGLTILKNAGIEVKSGILAATGHDLNRRFFTFFTKKRPYVILKWAETADGFIAGAGGQPVSISNGYSSQLVHRWRSEEDAILVGRQTVVNDNPRLNVRHWSGISPLRVVLDRNLRLPQALHVFDRSQPTIVYNYLKSTEVPETPERYASEPALAFAQIEKGEDELSQVLADLHKRKVQSVLVEGGTQVISAFINAGLWDEIRHCQSLSRLEEISGVKLSGNAEPIKGIKAPVTSGTLVGFENIDGDLWKYYRFFDSQVYD
ncbi:bifunctional diaminohydroxyphosphoribosylaminopyrimidine deaminase/5-amino-6-(5-phosphoribosylamino)uracil reductase RibD [Persicitalea jodogahamensis]|uniref:Riboflavin biosynthesis protein RibD n=1 Tax=Persicitalea jodogahamensis TaxID=402147 RepID=A0A8J3G7K4_9BACT|nr:bifunctional diaminohydroxyphosphoribosylaminopyrimidine deaminase/5-amino-6-(5-phosphoribosylamino)uracil reductase RibD [Persicitalea jodogahamensis]GHB57216.1 riboflavin biosynthesis protein RibD [Persicitalea jodogahamensis]